MFILFLMGNVAERHTQDPIVRQPHIRQPLVRSGQLTLEAVEVKPYVFLCDEPIP
jgi:hypothetical protein